MSDRLFTSMSDKTMSEAIDRASRRVVVLVPGIRLKTADAICRAAERLDPDGMVVVLDCDEEVFRLGYGELDALERVRQRGVTVRHCAGLRCATLVCDDRAWAFTPTALYVQDQVQSEETPNAYRLSAQEADRIAARASAPLRDQVARRTHDRSARREIERAETEVGQDAVSDEQVSVAKQALALAPPIRFDVARMVRVFQPYIQYVTIRLEGCAIQRRRVRMPRSLLSVGGETNIMNRLHTTFDLIEKGSKISSSALEGELAEIRDNFTRPLGRPWGRVLLRAKRVAFDEQIEAFGKKVQAYRKALHNDLKAHIDHSRDAVIECYLPAVLERPPKKLSGQITTERPDEKQARAWLTAELKRVFPSADSLTRGMTLHVHYQDVTFETLKQDGFSEKLRDAFPHVDWAKPFCEFQAAQEKQAHASR